MEIKDRLHRLRQKFAEKEIEAVFISQPENLYYLSGCEGLEGYLLITAEKVLMATDFRYIEQAERQSPDCELCRIAGKMAEWLPGLLGSSNIKRLGFESSHLSVASFEQMADIVKKANVSIDFVPVSGLIESIRMVKDREELRLIAEAGRITGAALAYIDEILKPGMTEKDLAWEIEKYMREKGSQPVPFELIVAAGPNSALPHAKPSGYTIRAGEPVVVDIGSKCGYYTSDMTRTFCFGKPDETFKKVYQTVLDAQLTAISSIKEGMTGHEADAVARQVIAQAGYGEAFGHSLGHGIGLITHENPRLGPNSTDILVEGMVFTIEPGIYLSGWGGVRIEDDVIIENGELRVITSARK